MSNSENGEETVQMLSNDLFWYDLYLAGDFSTLYLLTPVAMIITKAGGIATNGTSPILDLKPKSKEETSPITFGSKAGLERLMRFKLSEAATRTYFPPLP